MYTAVRVCLPPLPALSSLPIGVSIALVGVPRTSLLFDVHCCHPTSSFVEGGKRGGGEGDSTEGSLCLFSCCSVTPLLPFLSLYSLLEFALDCKAPHPRKGSAAAV